MTETKENVTIDFKRVSKIALKTLSNLFIGIMFAFCVIFFVAPSFSLKISKTFGSLNGQELCYERIYTQSGNISDLYNLILINDQQDDYESAVAYINQITKMSNYSEFCGSLDKASLEKIGSNLELIPYSCDANAYIRRQKVVCMYNLDGDLTTEVLVQTVSGSLSDVSIAVYIDLINDDESLTESKKIEKVVELMNKGIVVGGSYTSAQTIIGNRISDLENELAKENVGLANRIILQYSLVKLYRAEYLINVYLDNETEANQFKVLYQQENTKLVNLYN